MFIPATPAPSPSPEGPSTIPSSPPPAFGWGTYSNRCLQGRVGSHNSNNTIRHTCSPEPQRVHNDFMLHPSLLRPLTNASVEDMLLPLPPVTDLLNHIQSQRAASEPKGIKSFRPPTPSPGQVECLSTAGYVYDLGAAVLPTGTRSYTLMTAHFFSPSVTYYEGPLHACVFQCTPLACARNEKVDDMARSAGHTKHGVLVCELCLKIFYNEAAAIAHDRTHLGRFYCGSCKKDFNTSAARESHWFQYLGCREDHDRLTKSAAEEAVHNWHEYALAVHHSSPM